MYPQAFKTAVDQVVDTPHDKNHKIVDGFIALEISQILSEFAQILQKVGINDVDDPHQELAHVDLSAAEDGKDNIDDEAVRRSFLDDDATPTQETDRSIARSANVANDAEYNAALREAAKWRGLQEAQKITRKRTGLRYRGKIALKGATGAHANPGDLIQNTNRYSGLVAQKLRVIGVTHQISSSRFETIIDCEEDENVEA